MKAIQKGTWRRDAEGIYRIFISGSEQPEGTLVEVSARYNPPTYITIISRHSSIKGGTLYTFKYTHKPKSQTSTIPVVEPHMSSVTHYTEISTDELDKALGLN